MYGSWMGQFAWTATTLLWMTAAFGLGVGVTVLWYWLRKRGTQMIWYEWVLGLLGVALLAFMVQNITAAGFEEFDQTVPMFLLFFGLPAILLIALSWRLVSRRASKNQHSA